MQYYRIPQRHAGRRVPGGYYELIAGELFTAKECNRLGLRPEALEPVNISRRRIYWLFGARFEGSTSSKV